MARMLPFSLKLFALLAGAASIVIVRHLPGYSMRNSHIWTALVTFLFEIFVWAFYNVLVYPHFFSPLRHLPQPTGGSLFTGQLGRILREPSGQPARDWNRTIPHDGLVRYLGLFNIERIIVFSTKGLSEVLTQRPYDFVKPAQARNVLKPLTGVGILLAEGDEHRFQRKNLMPAFSYRHIKDLYPTFWSKSRHVVQAIGNEIANRSSQDGSTDSAVTIEFADWASRVSLDIIGIAGMGQDFNAIDNPNGELNRVYRRILTPSKQGLILSIIGQFLPQWLLRAIPVKRNEDLREAIKVIRKTSLALIQQKKEKLARKEQSGVDIISVALHSGAFSDENLLDQTMTFLAAGHETTSAALTWGVYAMCKYPAMQTRLRKEIRQRLPPLDDETWADNMQAEMIEALPYLRAVCNEVLRVYSPIPMTLRAAAVDTTILGQPIPKGTKVIVSPLAINTCKSLWGEDADDFNPDRWMGVGKANSGGAESNYAFMTFLHGPRSCIGQSFSKAEFACLLAAVVGRFELQLADPDKPIHAKGGVTMKPAGGLQVKMRPLQGW